MAVGSFADGRRQNAISAAANSNAAIGAAAIHIINA